MAIRYRYNNKFYSSEYMLRQAIFEKTRTAFGELTDALKHDLEIVEEEYDPRDDWTTEQWESSVRSKRDRLLAECDYFVMPDYPASDKDKEVVSKYRQELRDISIQKGFPKNVVFPEKPSVLECSKEYLGLAVLGI